MEKKYYVLHLLPPRPTFAMDMNEEEKAIMQQHVVYWKGLLDAGSAIVYGPVIDPKGPYGLGIVWTLSEEQLQSMISKDPARAICRYEWFAMQAVVRE